ncbi:MAG TPA: hypothetical protein VFU12_14775 [Glycomyces sp.]|nr:hypothetical protein [Glycomyces sp.]
MTGDAPAHPAARRRRDADLRLVRGMWIIAAVLLAWLAIGFFREPPASWQERSAAGVLAACFALPPLLTRGYRKRLPALDRTPRTATVTGHEAHETDPDSDSDMPRYDLVAVTVDLGGAAAATMIADIVAEESIDRFAVGSTWSVYAFADPAALNDDPDRTRVILTEAHDDVVRAGYDLGYYTLHCEAGPGSDLLLRRFANDPR